MRVGGLCAAVELEEPWLGYLTKSQGEVWVSWEPWEDFAMSSCVQGAAHGLAGNGHPGSP